MEDIPTKMTSKRILRTLSIVQNVSQTPKDSRNKIGTPNPYFKRQRKKNKPTKVAKTKR